MYAIIRTGGKQYRVEEGRSITVERLRAEQGSTVELRDVLLIADNGETTVGTPLIEGARVLADVEEQGKHDKIIVFKFKSKVRTRKKTGHRQLYTRLAVKEILRPGQEAKTTKPAKASRKKAEEAEEPKAKVAVAEPTEEPAAAVETPVAAAPEAAAPKRTRRKAEAADEPAKQPARKRATRKTAPKAAAEKKPAAKKTSEDKPARKRPARKTTKKETE